MQTDEYAPNQIFSIRKMCDECLGLHTESSAETEELNCMRSRIGEGHRRTEDRNFHGTDRAEAGMHEHYAAYCHRKFRCFYFLS